MPRKLTTLLVAASLLGATALTACGGGDDSSTPAAAAAATPAHTASHESAPAKNDAAPAEKPKSGPVSADISGFAFSPANIEVEVGQEITWTNRDAAPHTVTATSGAGFDSGTLDQGKSYTWKATKAGTVEYFCEIHPSMVGTITVK